MPPDLKFFGLQGLHFGNWDGSLSQNGISCGAEYSRSLNFDFKVFLIKKLNLGGLGGSVASNTVKNLIFHHI